MFGKNRFIKKMLSLFLSAAVIGGTAAIVPLAVSESSIDVSAASVEGVVSGMCFSTKSITILSDSTYNLKKILLNPGPGTLKWESSRPEIVKVSRSGVLTPIKSGISTITVTASDGKRAKCAVTVKAVPKQIGIDPVDTVLVKGKSRKLTYTIKPAGIKDKVEWSSDDTSVATVSSTGLVTAVGKGETYINVCTSNGLVTSIRFTVKVKPESVSLNNSYLRLQKGSSKKLTATVLPADTNDKSVKWFSSNSKVASVNNGVVTAKGVGRAKITAKAINGKSAVCIVSVYTVPNKIVLSKKTVSLKTNEKYTIKAVVYPTAAENKTVVWSSSDNSVAAVNQGVVTAKSPGTAVIMAATSNGIVQTCTVTVKAPDVLPEAIYLDAEELSIEKGKVKKITASVYPSNAVNKKITWSSNNTSVATVTNGYVTAKGAGTAYITARTSNGIKAKCKVVVYQKTVQTKAQINFMKAVDCIQKNHQDSQDGVILLYDSDTYDSLEAYFGLLYYKEDNMIEMVDLLDAGSESGMTRIKIEYNSLGKADASIMIYANEDEERYVKSGLTVIPSDLTVDSEFYFTDVTSTNPLDEDYATSADMQALFNNMIKFCIYHSDELLKKYGLDISYLGFTAWN